MDELWRRDEKPLGSFLALESAGKLLNFRPVHSSIHSPLLCLNIDGTEPELIFLDDPVDTTVIRRFGNEIGIINSATVALLEQQLYHQLLKLS